MATYPPPNYTEPLTVFNPDNWERQLTSDTTITIDYANANYLQYPVAQGGETLSTINVNGIATFNNDIILNESPTANITATNELTIQNGLTYDLSVSSGNILTLAGNQIFMSASEIINQGSYNQNVNRNNTNPTDITTGTELMVCSTIGNNLTMLPYTSYYQGFTFKVCNITNSVITLTSADIDFYSWLRGNVGLVYSIQPHSSISGYLLIPAITLGVALWFVRDDFGYKTINSTQNSTHYLNFSDSSGTGVGNIQKTAGIECNPFTNTITATTFSGSATGVSVIDNNSNLMYPVMIQGSAGDNKQLYADIATTPFSYSASTGTLTTPQLNCTSLNSTGTSPTCNLWNTIVSSNVNMMNLFATGTINFAPSLSTGTINIATNAQTTGNINIGSAGSTTGALVVNCDLICNKNITAPSLSVNSILTTSDNTNGSYYIPFSKTTAGANTSLFLDDTTGPFTYNPSNGGLTFSIGVCPRYDSSSNTANCSLFGNTSTGNIVIANAQTTGNITIGNAQTTGNINIGSTAVGTSSLVNIRLPLVLEEQLRTSNSVSATPTNDLDLGKTFTYFGSNFANTNLAANIVLNVLSESFASARFGTYLITANVIIKPTNTTAVRNCQISISTALGTIQSPYFVRTYSAIGGNVATLFITRVVPIYTATTITLTALCDTNATIDNGVTDNLLTFTRIA